MSCWAPASGLRSAGTTTHCWNHWGMAGWALGQSGCSGSPPAALVDIVQVCAQHGGIPVSSVLSEVWEKGLPAVALSHWKCLGAWPYFLHPLAQGYTPWAAQCWSHQGPEKERQESLTPSGWLSQVWAILLHITQGAMFHLPITCCWHLRASFEKRLFFIEISD